MSGRGVGGGGFGQEGPRGTARVEKRKRGQRGVKERKGGRSITCARFSRISWFSVSILSNI